MSPVNASSLLSSRLLWASVGGILTMGSLILWRSYPWQLGLMSGAAVGVLVFFTVNAIHRLRQEFGPRS